MTSESPSNTANEGGESEKVKGYWITVEEWKNVAIRMNESQAEIRLLNNDITRLELDFQALAIKDNLAREQLKACRVRKLFRPHIGCGLQTGDDLLGCSATLGISF